MRLPGVGLADWLAAAPGSGAPPAFTPAGNIDESGLDARTHALVRLAALIADGQCKASYDEQVTAALDYGVTADEIAGILVALLPALGAARVQDAAPGVLGAVRRATADGRVRPA
jgi:alkylhydroperoxidase/carboxymuconolactone decarboxylase family protein YurZ